MELCGHYYTDPSNSSFGSSSQELVQRLCGLLLNACEKFGAPCVPTKFVFQGAAALLAVSMTLYFIINCIASREIALHCFVICGHLRQAFRIVVGNNSRLRKLGDNMLITGLNMLLIFWIIILKCDQQLFIANFLSKIIIVDIATHTKTLEEILTYKRHKDDRPVENRDMQGGHIRMGISQSRHWSITHSQKQCYMRN